MTQALNTLTTKSTIYVNFIVGTIKKEYIKKSWRVFAINGKQEQADPRGTKTAMI
jgi:hypothetical protein